MAYNAFVGSFNLDSAVTAGNDQSVTGVGFQPKVVLFWWSGSTSDVDSIAGGTIRAGFGAAISSTSRFACTMVSDDGVADSDTYRYQGINECIRIYSDGDGTLDGLADFKSQDADGFTLTIDDQFGSDWRISFLALGGDDLTDVYIGNALAADGSVGGVGFQPDALITASAGYYAATGGAASGRLMLGMATGPSNEGVIYGNTTDNQVNMSTLGYGYNGEVVSQGSMNRYEFVQFEADGFEINALETTSTLYYHFVCLAGGQYAVGDLTTRTDGNDIEENVGFEPVAVLFASANRALSTQDATSDHFRISIGAGTATDERAVQAVSDESGLADSETAYTNQDDAVYAHVVDDAIEALMDLKSIDADGFTCVMDDTETAGCWVSYLAIGAEPSAGGEPGGVMRGVGRGVLRGVG